MGKAQVTVECFDLKIKGDRLVFQSKVAKLRAGRGNFDGSLLPRRASLFTDQFPSPRIRRSRESIEAGRRFLTPRRAAGCAVEPKCDVESYLRRRSFKSDFTPDTECLSLMPFIFLSSLTGRVGSTISAEGAFAGTMRATRCSYSGHTFTF